MIDLDTLLMGFRIIGVYFQSMTFLFCYLIGLLINCGLFYCFCLCVFPGFVTR